MRSDIRQFDYQSWPIFTGPVVVFTRDKNVMETSNKITAGFGSAHSRDGPTIFHMRDGPPNVTGPPGGTGPPRFSSESGPPKTTGPPMEWLVRKRSLKESEKSLKISLAKKRKNLNIKNLNEIYKEENTMKTSKRNKLIGLALIGSYSLFNATGVLAAAGDTISNRATLNYDVGGSAQVLIESGTGVGNSTPGATNGSDTDFLEDRLINFTVTRGGATSEVTPNATLQAVEYTIENLGNGSQGFLLKALNNADGAADPFGGANTDVFDPTLLQTFVEDGTTPGFQPAEDTDAFIASLAVTPATQIVYVVSTIPATQSDGITALVNADIAVMTLIAQVAIDGSSGILADAIIEDSNGNTSPGGTGFTNGTVDVPAGSATIVGDLPTVVDIVFNDGAGTLDGTGAAGATQNAQHADDSSYTVQSAELTVSKNSLALWDPINLDVDPKSIPSSYVRYTITVENAVGAADADLTTLSDALTAALNLDPDFRDGTAANNPTSALGNAIQITHVDNAVTNFCTGDVGDIDLDGCSYTGGAGGTVTANILTVMGAANAQLAAGESLTITFNVIVE